MGLSNKDLTEMTELFAVVDEALSSATDALMWVTGHHDFGEGGTYREGWLKVGQPALDKLLAFVDVPDDATDPPVPDATA